MSSSAASPFTTPEPSSSSTARNQIICLNTLVMTQENFDHRSPSIVSRSLEAGKRSAVAARLRLSFLTQGGYLFEEKLSGQYRIMSLDFERFYLQNQCQGVGNSKHFLRG